jgi:hypothetical protein
LLELQAKLLSDGRSLLDLFVLPPPFVNLYAASLVSYFLSIIDAWDFS